MELKKSEKADLENKKGVFLLLGLVLALGIVLLAFEWTTKPSEVESLGTLDAVQVEEEVIPITRQEEVKVTPPPPVTVVEVLNIVDNTQQVNDDLSIFDSEATNETLVDVAPIVIETNQEEEKEEDTQVFIIVEEMPEFTGGEAALRAFLAKSINYPVIDQENGIQGKVYVTFVVEKDGGISEAKVARGVDPSLDKEALLVVNILPKWKHGKQRCKPVRVSYTVPISFVLQ